VLVAYTDRYVVVALAEGDEFHDAGRIFGPETLGPIERVTLRREDPLMAVLLREVERYVYARPHGDAFVVTAARRWPRAVTGAQLSRITAALRSLSDCTSVDYWSGGINCHLERRNSPYLSHRAVEYSVSARAGAGVLLASNGERVLALIHTPHYTDLAALLEPGDDEEIVAARIPVALPAVARFIARAREHLPVPEFGAMVSVATLWPRLLGWTEDGRPILAGAESEPEAEPRADAAAAVAVS
jgi:hypothetical protein